MRGGQTKEDNSLWIVLGSVIALLAIIWLWEQYAANIYAVLLQIAKFEALPFQSFPGMSNFHNVVSSLDPNEMVLSDMMAVLDRAGRWYAWLLAPFMAYYMRKAWQMSARERFRRTLNMQKLLNNNASLYPCIAPILNWGRSILQEPTDSGPWMVARQPIQFVAEHGLLKDSTSGEAIPKNKILGENQIANPDSPIIAGAIKARFDRDGAAALFKKQFGEEFQSLEKLPPYLYALASAFLLFGAGRKADGQKILDNMSASFRPPVETQKACFLCKPPFYKLPRKGRKSYAISTKVHVSKKEISGLWQSEDIQKIIRPHNRYRNLVILALYAHARKKGVVSSAEFIWLRPVNRRLFYLLNNYGRRTAWVEIAGPWVHYQAEEALGNHDPNFSGTNISVEEKQVQPAVNALELAMYEEGWIQTMSDAAKKGRLEFS